MSLTYSLQTARDLYSKLGRDAAALEGVVNADHAFNFLVTAYHLAEWVSKDPSLPPDVNNRMNDAKNDVAFRLCADLANASKHFVQNAKADAKKTVVTQGYGVGRYGAGPYGVGEESITITKADASNVNLLELRDQIMNLYAAVFDA